MTEGTQEVALHCSTSNVPSSARPYVAVVEGSLKQGIQEQLAKSEVACRWTEEPDAADVRIRLVDADEGNRVLRFLVSVVPVFWYFIGPPWTLEIEGEIVVPDGEPTRFHVIEQERKAILDTETAFKACALRAAKRIADQIKNSCLSQSWSSKCSGP